MAKRGKVPSLITGSSGRPKKVTASRLRKCSYCKCSIVKGSYCFEIPKVGGGFTNNKSHCLECFRKILGQSQSDLDKLIMELGDEK